MKLFTRIFLGFLLIATLSAVFLFRNVMDELRPATRQAMEEAMVDTANLLAEIVGPGFAENGNFSADFAASIDRFLKRKPQADIWGYKKNSASYRIYVTDSKGIVVYDSLGDAEIGKDYSRWNDVYLTLRGKYGARSSRADESDGDSSILYIAAPIRKGTEIIGVLTVAKPALSIQPFIDLSEKNILHAAAVLLLAALLFSWLLSYWLTRSVHRLSAYAHDVSEGKKVALPKLSEPELLQLGQAMETMRRELEGKDYAERYIQTLTHEIKSPLSGIRGAAELLSEEMAATDRERFLANIRDDAGRIQHIIDRLLELAAVEFQQELHVKAPVSLSTLLANVAQQKIVPFAAKSLKLEMNHSTSRDISGDAFLIGQAISNIFDNAIDFSPVGGLIRVEDVYVDGVYRLIIRDQGLGIPDFAEGRVFERFYSLPRPDTGRKSSGLGLNFVREVMELHGGNIELRSDLKGTEVTLSFPVP